MQQQFHQPTTQAGLHLVIPFLPPTGNHIYTDRRGGGRILSDEAKAFRGRFLMEVTPHYLPAISRLDPSSLYRIGYVFYFLREDLINTGFEKGKAKTRYKKMDVENRLKLISDCVVKAIGIDDCQFFGGAHDKRCCELVGGMPQVHVFLTPASPSEFGL